MGHTLVTRLVGHPLQSLHHYEITHTAASPYAVGVQPTIGKQAGMQALRTTLVVHRVRSSHHSIGC